MKTKRHILPLLTLTLSLLTLISLLGCRNNAAVTDRPIVAVSIEPQRWLLERIVGDKMEVRSLLAQGGNPETYEPTFANLAAIERSQAYFTVGHLGFEDAIVQKLHANNPNLRIVSSTDSIALLYATHGNHDHGADPHLWSSATNARQMAANMLRVILQIDPANSPTYRQNYQALTAHIDSVQAACDSILAPVRGQAFIIWHPSLSYFARDFGLRQIPLSAEGKEQTITQTRALIDSIQALGPTVFLIQKDLDPAQTQTLQHSNTPTLKTVTINPLAYEWDTEMLHTARAIANTTD